MAYYFFPSHEQDTTQADFSAIDRILGKSNVLSESRAFFSTGPSPATKTTLAIHSGTLGQAITFDVTVRDLAALGAPTGTVDIIDHGTVIQSLDLSPGVSANAKFAVSTASFTIPGGAGGSAYYFGHHAISAVFSGSDTLRASHTSGAFGVKMPHYTTLPGKLKFGTVIAGSGPGIAAGQTASMLYTGYLVKNGQIFDESNFHGGTPFQFVVEATNPEQVIPGFDQATVGMQQGETRVIVIPPALGYGKTGAPPTIPANAKLVFLVTLEGIS